MEEAGRHAAFIWAAYGLTGLVALALVVRAIVGERLQARALARLEDATGDRRVRG